MEVETSKKCTPLWREAISKSSVLKTDGLGPLLDVQMSKCTRLWREAISKSKVLRTDGLGALLDVQMSFRK